MNSGEAPHFLTGWLQHETSHKEDAPFQTILFQEKTIPNSVG
jgi:hypothetical protein